MLIDAGVNQNSIRKVAIPKIPVRLEMLLSNKVDAVLLPDPFATLAEFQGAKVVADDTYDNISQVVLLFSSQAINDKRDAVKKLIKIYGEAGKMLTLEPEKYRETFLKNARIPTPIQDTYKCPTFSLPQLPTEKDITNVINWMVEKGLLEKPFSYKDMVDTTLLN